MKPGANIGKRYLLVRQLGKGGSAVTWLADDRETGKRVVLKLLSLGGLEQWKAYELFEREAGVLRNLHHEGIPAYLDSFKTGAGAKAELVLVQEYVEGANLQQKVASGWRGTQEEICAIMARLLEAVRYIHSLWPPIIHRDINPRNVVLREDGAVFLVDFGGVQDAMRVTASAGQTVIGTPGYMPLEQFVGRATVRSDLYACAATMLFLLTHKNPQDLPVKDMKIDVQSILDIPPGPAAVLDSWLEPDEARRGLSIEDAITWLRGGTLARSRGQDGASAGDGEDADGVVDLPPPRFSRISATREGDVVTLTIPDRGAAGGGSVLGGFSLFWIAFVAFWTFATLRLGAWPMSLFSIPFWLVGFFLVRRAVGGLFGRTLIRFDPARGFSYEHRLLFRKVVLVPAAEVGALSLAQTGSSNGQPITSLRFEIGARRFTFGESLSSDEKTWVKASFNGLRASMTKAGTPGSTLPPVP